MRRRRRKGTSRGLGGRLRRGLWVSTRAVGLADTAVLAVEGGEDGGGCGVSFFSKGTLLLVYRSCPVLSNYTNSITKASGLDSHQVHSSAIANVA